MKHKLIFLLSLLLATTLVQAQVTIGSAKKPIQGALLMLDDGTIDNTVPLTNAKGGLGMPRVSLTGKYDELKMGTNTVAQDPDGTYSSHIGLLVYNTGEDYDKCDSESPTAGLHVWDGDKWMGINAAPPYKHDGKGPGPASVYTANCYIATAGARITIPVEKAFAIWDWWGGGQHPNGKILAETSDDFSTNLTVAVLWEEDEEGVSTGNPIIGSVSFNPSSVVSSIAKNRTANIYVNVKAGVVGNAVVTVSDAIGVRWSWHIWVPKTNPTITTYTHNTGKQTNIFMDRNLGASRNNINDIVTDRAYTVGFTYQWGRKDPFPGFVTLDADPATSQYISKVPVNTTNNLDNIQSPNGDGKATGLQYAINNPLGFIKNIVLPFDWYSSIQSDWNCRWGDATDECRNRYTYKSEMDPCPDGWRVPGYSGDTEADSPWAKDGVLGNPLNGNPLNDYTTNTTWKRGLDFTDPSYPLGWHPAAGYRYRNNGSLNYIRERGFYWSATPKIGSNHAYQLEFSKTNIYTPKSYDRAFGYSVRCVQERL